MTKTCRCNFTSVDVEAGDLKTIVGRPSLVHSRKVIQLTTPTFRTLRSHQHSLKQHENTRTLLSPLTWPCVSTVSLPFPCALQYNLRIHHQSRVAVVTFSVFVARQEPSGTTRVIQEDRACCLYCAACRHTHWLLHNAPSHVFARHVSPPLFARSMSIRTCRDFLCVIVGSDDRDKTSFLLALLEREPLLQRSFHMTPSYVRLQRPCPGSTVFYPTSFPPAITFCPTVSTFLQKAILPYSITRVIGIGYNVASR